MQVMSLFLPLTARATHIYDFSELPFPSAPIQVTRGGALALESSVVDPVEDPTNEDCGRPPWQTISRLNMSRKKAADKSSTIQ
jgi:hypothetical protein